MGKRSLIDWSRRVCHTRNSLHTLTLGILTGVVVLISYAPSRSQCEGCEPDCLPPAGPFLDCAQWRRSAEIRFRVKTGTFPAYLSPSEAKARITDAIGEWDFVTDQTWLHGFTERVRCCGLHGRGSLWPTLHVAALRTTVASARGFTRDGLARIALKT